MINFGFILFVLWVISVFLSFNRNSDVFSFSKVYAVIFLTFFGEIFLLSENYLLGTQICCLILILCNYLIIIWEKKIILPKWNLVFTRKAKFKIITIIWILTAVPIFSQLYLISFFGGIEPYLSSIAGRAKEWEGLGSILLLTKTLNILSYFYFIIFIKNYHRSKSALFSFIIHLSIFILLGVLSGSRSNLLLNFVFMIVFYHYNVRNISIKKAVIGFSVILLLAMILGVARGNYKFSEGSFSTGLDYSQNTLNLSNFKYGLQPIDQLFKYENIYDPKYGSTFLAGITNVIPRSIWNSKPDTGGVVITSKYFNNRFDGYANYTTGIIPEGIINFGFYLGFLLSIMILILGIKILIYVQSSINRFAFSSITNKKQSISFFFMSGIYVFLLFGIPSYIYAEFATNTVSLLVYKISLFIIIVCSFRKLLKKSIYFY